MADGQVVTYSYAWKGGPRLPGKPGDPDFVAAYNRAVARRIVAPEGTLQSILDAYQESDKFREGIADRTRRDYIKHIKQIEIEFGDFPIAALTDKRAKGEFMDWRDRLARRSRRQADYTFTVLSAALSWALERSRIDANPCRGVERLYDGNRVDKVWEPDHEAAFLAVASRPLRLAFLMGIWTGQRQGDLLRLTWTAYDGERIRLRQSKTGIRVMVPVAGPLKAELDTTKRLSPIILVNTRGKPWDEDGFRKSWRTATRKAGIIDLTFNDLRGTAVTRMAINEATEPEIAAVTGHTLRDVRSILDANYLHRDPALAENAIRKLERGTKPPK